jgi:hypothetical protein
VRVSVSGLPLVRKASRFTSPAPEGANRDLLTRAIGLLYHSGRGKAGRFAYQPEEAKRDALLTSRKRQSGTLYLLLITNLICRLSNQRTPNMSMVACRARLPKLYLLEPCRRGRWLTGISVIL